MKRVKWYNSVLAALLAAVMFILSIVPGMPVNAAAPESVASAGYTNPYMASSKKGIQVNSGIISDVEDLGISEGFFNIFLSDLLSNTPTEYTYDYKGKTYYFNEGIVNIYDYLVKSLSDAGINVTVDILNLYKEGYEYLVRPGITMTDGVSYYALNTVTQEGRDSVEAACRFVASRYNGGSYGTVSNYAVGNEVNDNKAYNHMGEMDIDEYVAAYYDTFKVIYDAVKAEKPDAGIYISLEHRWATENNRWDYAGRDFLLKFDALSKKDGNLDWSLSFHPYSHPLTNMNVLTDNWASWEYNGKICTGGEITDSPDTKLISMKNLHVLTDFMQSETMRNKQGEVRSIILGEQGYTSISPLTKEPNEILQAASIAYAYYVAEMNPYIDAFILSGHADVYAESEYYKFGIWHSDENNNATTAKLAHDVYKYIDTDISLQVTEFAPETLGIASWEIAVPGFDADKFKHMKSITAGAVYSVEDTAAAKEAELITSGMQVSEYEGEYRSSFWNAGYACSGFSLSDYDGNYYPSGLAVFYGSVYPLTYQSVYHDFDIPMDMSGTPYLGFCIKLIPNGAQTLDGQGAQEELVVRIRVYSGEQLYEANCSVKAGEENTVFADLSDWKYKNSVDRVEVWVRGKDTENSFDGTAAIYNLTRAADIGEKSAMPAALDITPPELEADPFEATVYNGADFSLIYDPEYYVNNNRDLEAFRNSPVLLLDHFVTYGMYEKRQADENFNLEAYMKYNPDLVSIFGDSYHFYYFHYLEKGHAEGRKARYDGDVSGYNTPAWNKPDGEEGDIPDIPNVYSDVFNAAYYYTHNADVAAAYGKDAEALLEHFVLYGMSEGRQGCWYFDPVVYKETHKDLRDTFGDDYRLYYEHWIECGRYEGRNGIIHAIPEGPYVRQEIADIPNAYSDVFSAPYYYRNNADIAASEYGGSAELLLEHFVKYGMAEGRQGCKEFNPKVYKGNYEDLNGTFGDDWSRYYRHYIDYGKAEGRNGATDISQDDAQGGAGIEDIPNAYSDVFSASYYYAHNADVAGSEYGGSGEALLEHFVRYGMAEGRQGCETFNPKIYRENYEDLNGTFGDDWTSYYHHYMDYGKAEGRTAAVLLRADSAQNNFETEEMVCEKNECSKGVQKYCRSVFGVYRFNGCLLRAG